MRTANPDYVRTPPPTTPTFTPDQAGRRCRSPPPPAIATQPRGLPPAAARVNRFISDGPSDWPPPSLRSRIEMRAAYQSMPSAKVRVRSIRVSICPVSPNRPQLRCGRREPWPSKAVVGRPGGAADGARRRGQQQHRTTKSVHVRSPVRLLPPSPPSDLLLARLALLLSLRPLCSCVNLRVHICGSDVARRH